MPFPASNSSGLMMLRSLALAGFIGFLAAVPVQALLTIELVGGGAVTGHLLLEKQDRLVVDLGYTTLEIPRTAIVRLVAPESGNPAAESTVESPDLFHSLRHPVSLPIKELAARDGAAIVLIRTPTGLGSGFLIHPDGYIVTNDHVIAGEHKLSVTVFTGAEGNLTKDQFDHVRILASSPEQDLALLKIETPDNRRFHSLPIGNSDALRPGIRTFAIGNPLGLERSVSEGIISIGNRPIGGRLYIQHTAQISPGNSGGPLLNLQGEVVGVINMKVVAMGAEGLAFAIPSSSLKTFLLHRDAFAFDPRNPNAGFRYLPPPTATSP